MSPFLIHLLALSMDYSLKKMTRIWQSANAHQHIADFQMRTSKNKLAGRLKEQQKDFAIVAFKWVTFNHVLS